MWRTIDYAVHGLTISAYGTRAYLAQVEDYVTTTATGAGGLVVLDVSEVQQPLPDPDVREVARLTWPEVSIPQNNLPVTIGGRHYVIQFDEFDSNVYGNDPEDLVGGVHLIDIEDETQPRVVSRIRLEVHQREARASDQQDDPGNQRVGQGYAAHYCAVPRSVDPGIVACSMILSGLRVFDIRDPERPREVAYFNQARSPRPTPASGAPTPWRPPSCPSGARSGTRTATRASSASASPTVWSRSSPVPTARAPSRPPPPCSVRAAPPRRRVGGAGATGTGQEHAAAAAAAGLVAVLVRSLVRAPAAGATSRSRRRPRPRRRAP